MTDDTDKQADDDFAAGFEAAEATFAGETDDAPETASTPEPAADKPESDDSGKTKPDSPEAEDPPWYEKYPEELRGEVMQLAQRAQNMEHSFRSEQARSVGQQRKAQELEARLAEIEKAEPKGEQKTGSGPFDATMQALEEQLPEVADVLRELRQQNEQLRAEIDRRVAPVEQTSQAFHASQQEAALQAAHPDWRDVATTSEFNAAMATAPRMIREAFERNSASIQNAEDAAFVIDWYKGQNAAAPPSPQTNSPVDQVRQKREAKIKSAVAPAVRDSVIPTGDDAAEDDFDAGFADADRKIRQGIL